METTSDSKKKCRFCGELIQADAIKCRYCGEFLDEVPPDAAHADFQNPMYDEHMDNRLLLEIRPSLAAMAGSFIGSAVFLALAAFIAFFLPQPYTGWIGLALALAVLLWLSLKVLTLKCICYRVSSDRIEYQRGVLSRSTDNLDMFRVTDLRLHQTLLDRLFGMGTVEVISSDETHPTLWLTNIPNPREAYDLLKQVSLNADRRRGVIHYEQ